MEKAHGWKYVHSKEKDRNEDAVGDRNSSMQEPEETPNDIPILPSPSSTHSRSSSISLRRKQIGDASDETAAKFDAALDAAVEAAYNRGSKNDGEDISLTNPGSTDYMKSSINPELAKSLDKTDNRLRRQDEVTRIPVPEPNREGKTGLERIYLAVGLPLS